MNAIVDQQRQVFPRYSHVELLDLSTATEWEIAIAHFRDDIEATDAAVDKQYDVAMTCIDRLHRKFSQALYELTGHVREILGWWVKLPPLNRTRGWLRLALNELTR